MQKIPYILVVGEKEKDANTVAVRARDNAEQEVISTDQFIQNITQKISEKK